MSKGTSKPTCRRRLSVRRLALAALGILCVGLAALGAVVPGLPTTVFLLAASYLFTRSCPYLEEKLIHNRLFAPFEQYLRKPSEMPPRARAIALVMMWASVLISTGVLLDSDAVSVAAPALILAAGALGTWCILRIRASDVGSRACLKAATVDEGHERAFSG